MNELDLELIKAKKRIKDIKKAKRLQRKLKRMQRINYKPHPYLVFQDLIFALIDLIKKGC